MNYNIEIENGLYEIDKCINTIKMSMDISEMNHTIGSSHSTLDDSIKFLEGIRRQILDQIHELNNHLDAKLNSEQTDVLVNSLTNSKDAFTTFTWEEVSKKPSNKDYVVTLYALETTIKQPWDLEDRLGDDLDILLDLKKKELMNIMTD